MQTINNLTAEQISNVNKLNFLYSEQTNKPKMLSENELYSRLVILDDSLRKKALFVSIAEGFAGFWLVMTGCNLLIHLSNSFMAGIIFFCIGMMMLSAALPLYQTLLKKSRKKYSPVVLTITNLLKKEK